MDRQIGGIHHVTAIARDPQANVDFGMSILPRIEVRSGETVGGMA